MLAFEYYVPAVVEAIASDGSWDFVRISIRSALCNESLGFRPRLGILISVSGPLGVSCLRYLY